MLAALLAVPLAALGTGLLILPLRPFLARYALARPNARSSHVVPTPQGGGLAILAAVVVAVAALRGLLAPDAADPVPPARELLALAAGAVALALLGAVDDVRPLPALPRLAVQALAVGLVVAAPEGRLLPGSPVVLERALALVAGLWFVNLVNFMDGLDWMSVAEGVPVAGALLGLGLLGHLDPGATLVAGALLGGLLGFAPFNRPVARLFLGDVGSLPLGLALAWLLWHLAAGGSDPAVSAPAGARGVVAALLLPLYYLADATSTLARRAARGARVWLAHRDHAYQRAVANGWPVGGVVGRVFRLNLALAGLAALVLAAPVGDPGPGAMLAAAALAAGGSLVGATLRAFARPPRRGAP